MKWTADFLEVPTSIEASNNRPSAKIAICAGEIGGAQADKSASTPRLVTLAIKSAARRQRDDGAAVHVIGTAKIFRR